MDGTNYSVDKNLLEDICEIAVFIKRGGGITGMSNEAISGIAKLIRERASFELPRKND